VHLDAKIYRCEFRGTADVQVITGLTIRCADLSTKATALEQSQVQIASPTTETDIRFTIPDYPLFSGLGPPGIVKNKVDPRPAWDSRMRPRYRFDDSLASRQPPCRLLSPGHRYASRLNKPKRGRKVDPTAVLMPAVLEDALAPFGVKMDTHHGGTAVSRAAILKHANVAEIPAAILTDRISA
jgi:hypothetical protein